MMTLDVVNDQNEKVGSLDLDSTVFGGVVNTGLIWESVVHQNASERSGTAATKTRGKVRGSGRKPWRQKGTGRARVGSVRNPIWRSGGTVFGPTPRDYGYALPHKMQLGALQAALKQQIATNSLIVVDRLAIEEAKTKVAAEWLKRLNAIESTLLVDVEFEASLVLAVRNLPGVDVRRVVELTARDVLGARQVIATRSAIERLQEVLGR